MKTIFKIALFCSAIYCAYSLCNTCSATTGLACVASDKFSVCVDGLPTTAVTQCPTGTVCSASSPGVCISSTSGTAAASCVRCGICSTSNLFACTSYNTFALCYGTTIPISANFTCSGTLVCNVDDPMICVNPADTGIGGTCPSSSTAIVPTTTTVSPAINPQTYCASLASSGRYELTTDPNCKQYVLCALVNNAWIGNIYECPGSTYFNSTSRLCGVEVPLRCA